MPSERVLVVLLCCHDIHVGVVEEHDPGHELVQLHLGIKLQVLALQEGVDGTVLS